MAPPPAVNNNSNKTRGQPKGKAKKGDQQQSSANGNYTLYDLRDKRKRSVSLDTGKSLEVDSSLLGSPAKKLAPLPPEIVPADNARNPSPPSKERFLR